MTQNMSHFNIWAAICAVAIFLNIPPYFSWFGIMAELSKVLLLVMGFLFFVNRKINNGYIGVLFLVFFCIIASNILISDKNYNYALATLCILFVPFASIDFTRKVSNYFAYIYVIIISLSLFVYILALVDIIHPYTTIPPLNSLKSYNYQVYPLLVKSADHALLRFCGPFDEPGVVGTINTMLLYVRGIDFRKKESIILLITGLFSLSLFFYVLIPLYFLVYTDLKQKHLPKIIASLFFVGLVAFSITTNEMLYDKIGRRFEWNSSKGKFEGQNRINQDVVYFYLAKSVNSGEIWTGIEEKGTYLFLTEGSSSIFNVIILYGVLFTFSYIIFFVFYGYHYYKKANIYFISYLFLILAVLYQRPALFKSVYLLLFVCMAHKNVMFNKTDKKRIKNLITLKVQRG